MTVPQLHLAAGLALPLETVTQSLAIIAKRRAGKSYASRRLAEQLIKAGQQVVIVDPKGDHWGIRSARDGRAPGLPVVILGGERGDVPLEVGAGEVVAKLLAEDRVTALLDLSLFRKHEVASFTGFLESLYRLKARELYRTPMMLILDEADAIAPQRPQKGEERMLGAAEDIVRRGGQRGLGCTLITQRSAVLNKNVLTQVQILIALRTIAPQDLAALNAWIDVHGTPEQRKTLMESLPALPVGEAWIWSPGWPTGEGIFQRAKISPIETFDSGATPKPGEKRIEPKHLADVDLGALRKQMAATLERAKSENPRLLRARIAELERELAKRRPIPPTPPPKIETRERPVLRKGELGRLEVLRKALSVEVQRLDSKAMRLNDALVQLDRRLDGLRAGYPVSDSPITPGVVPQPRQLPAILPVPRSQARPPDRAGLGLGQRKILIGIAQHAGGVTREQLTVLTGYRRSSRDTYLQHLTSRGLALNGDRIRITEFGLAALGGEFEPLPTGRDLLAHWLGRLGRGERRLLEVIARAFPDPIDRDELSAITGLKRSSRDTYLQKLCARRLIHRDRGAVRLSEDLVG